MNINSTVALATIMTTVTAILMHSYGVIRNLYTMYPPSKDPRHAAEMLNPPIDER